MKIHDPVFGILEYAHSSWEGHVDLQAFGGRLRLSVPGDEAHPPGEEERMVLSDLLNHQQAYRLATEQALFDYYNRHKALYRSWYPTPEQAWKRVPGLSESGEVWRLIEPTGVDFDLDIEDNVTLTLNFRTRWDEEHGFGVTFCGDAMGLGESGVNWFDADHYDLNGQPIRVEE